MTEIELILVDRDWVETLEYYDGPIISISNSLGLDFLELYVEAGKLLMIEVEEDEIIEFKEGKLSLYEIIQRRESVILVEWNTDKKQDVGKELKTNEIPAEWLPSKDYYYK